VQEGETSQIDTSGEADTLADAILADLKDPDVLFDIVVPLFPWVELHDLYTFEAEAIRFTADQDYAVTGYRHEYGPDGRRTTLMVSGQPRVGRDVWLQREADPTYGDLIGALSATPTITVNYGNRLTPQLAGEIYEADWDYYEWHRSESSSFTPNDTTFLTVNRSTTLEASDLEANTTYYYQAYVRDLDGNLSAASNEVQVDYAGVRAADLNTSLSVGVRATLSTDHYDNTSTSQVEWDTTAAGNSDLLTVAGDIEPGVAVNAMISCRLVPTGSSGATTWSVELYDEDLEVTLAQTATLAGDEVLEIPPLFVSLAATASIRTIVTFAGDDIDIDADGSYVQLIPTTIAG
jgi:hypothetical protein